MEETPQSILNYWYSKPVKQCWFNSTPELDLAIRERFELVWEQARVGKLDEWKQTPEGSLALIIILDQLPLNMFRQQAKSFATEQMAVQVARQGIEKKQDQQLPEDRRAFFYMPLMHSENTADQAMSVELYEQAGLESNLRFARHHQGIIEKFGRFPHRNAILKRQSTPEELEYLNSEHAFKG